MNVVRLILAALIALCIFMIYHLDKAHAQTVQIPCGPEKVFLDGLAKTSHEFTVIAGMLTNGKRMIVTASSSGTFSILESDGNIACMVAAGEKAELDRGI
jgi:hypothetical protein